MQNHLDKQIYVHHELRYSRLTLHCNPNMFSDPSKISVALTRCSDLDELLRLLIRARLDQLGRTFDCIPLHETVYMVSRFANKTQYRYTFI